MLSDLIVDSNPSDLLTCTSYTFFWLKASISNLTASCRQTSLTSVTMDVSVDLAILRRAFYKWAKVAGSVGNIPSSPSLTTYKCWLIAKVTWSAEDEKKYFPNSSAGTFASSSFVVVDVGWGSRHSKSQSLSGSMRFRNPGDYLLLFIIGREP